MRSVSIAAGACLLGVWIAGIATAESIFTSQFSSGLGPQWEIPESTASGGFVRIGGAGGRSDVQIMGRKGGTHENHNMSTLTMDLSKYHSLALQFDYFWTDSVNPFPSQAPYTGYPNVDGISISENGDDWYPLWSVQSGHSWNSVSLDLSQSINDYGLTALENFKIRFHHYNAGGNLRSFSPQGNLYGSWDNIALTGMTTPEPSTATLLIGGLAIGTTLRFRRRGHSSLSIGRKITGH